MRTSCFLPAALTMLASPMLAQCFEPNFGAPAAAPSALTGDVVLPIQPIGFAFPLAGTSYTDLHVCDKGYVWLSNAGVPVPGGADYSATAAELASGSPRIAPLWSDFQVVGANGGMIHVDSTASRCTVTWQNVQCYGATCAPFTMQLQLLPTGEVFFFFDDDATNNSTSPAWQVGVAGISPGGASLGALSDLRPGGVTVDGLVVEEWTAPQGFDLAGGGVGFVPTAPGWVWYEVTGCAEVEEYGEGCVQKAASVYEMFAGGAGFDLANTSLSWLRTPDGYAVLNSIPGTYVAPTAAAIALAGGADDGDELVQLSTPMPVAFGVTSSLNVSSNGTIEVASASTGNVDWSPSEAELLQWPNTVFACWHDFNQSSTGSGQVYFEEQGGVAYVTWDGVHSIGNGLPNTFQFQFDLGTGNVTLVMLAMDGVDAAGNALVGYSAAGQLQDPGAIDLSSAGLLAAASDLDQDGLRCSVNSLPRLGNLSFAVTVENVPNVAPLAFLFAGDTVTFPGVDLTFLGMPGCEGYTNGNLATASLPATPAGTASRAMPLSLDPALMGFEVSFQAAALSPDTPFQVVSSNGLRIRLGN
jgi:hypothetical protein